MASRRPAQPCPPGPQPPSVVSAPKRQMQLCLGRPAAAPTATSSEQPSPIWDYFARCDPGNDGKDVRCTVTMVRPDGSVAPCGFRMKAPPAGSGTGNYFRHLKAKHPAEATAAQEASARSTTARAAVGAAFAIQSGAQPTLDGKLVMGSDVRALHDRRYVIFSATSLRPCTMIEDESFKIFIGGFSPAYVSKVRPGLSTFHGARLFRQERINHHNALILVSLLSFVILSHRQCIVQPLTAS
jgi:hypothetical protein